MFRGPNILTLKGPEGGTVKLSNYSVEMLIESMETQCKFMFACLGPIEKDKNVLSVPV